MFRLNLLFVASLHFGPGNKTSYCCTQSGCLFSSKQAYRATWELQTLLETGLSPSSSTAMIGDEEPLSLAKARRLGRRASCRPANSNSAQALHILIEPMNWLEKHLLSSLLSGSVALVLGRCTFMFCQLATRCIQECGYNLCVSLQKILGYRNLQLAATTQ